MKRICLLAAVLLVTIHGIGQTWSIGLSGGSVWNSKTFRPWAGEHSSVIGGVAGLRLGCEKNGWEMGLTVDFRRYSLRYSTAGLKFEDQFDPATGTSVTPVAEQASFVVFRIPSLTIAPYVRYHFLKDHKLDLYAGASLGYCILFNKKTSGSDVAIWNMEKGADAFSPGMHAGAAYPLWRKLYIDAELNGIGVFSKPMSFFAATATIGLQYRIH